MRPLLRPGTHVLARGDGQLQVGLDPRQARGAPRHPRVRTALSRARRLRGRRRRPRHRHPRPARSRTSLVATRARCCPELAATGTAALRHGTAALARRLGTRAADARAAPAPPAGSRWPCFGHAARRRRCGRGMVELLAGSAPAGAGPAARPGVRPVGVLVGVGEPDRDLLDPWTRAGTPYALVRVDRGPRRRRPVRGARPHRLPALPRRPPHRRRPGVAAAGPPVRRRQRPRPGRRRTGAGRPALAALAVAWAVARPGHLRRRRPPSHAGRRRVTLDPDLAALETRTWLAAPGVRCAWS